MKLYDAIPEPTSPTAFSKKDKILLMMLPFWVPFIPPLGLASLKTFLKGHGYDVTTTDLNLLDELWDIHNRYFKKLNEFIDEETNDYNEKHVVQRNHFMAYLGAKDEEQYIEIVRFLVSTHCFKEITVNQAKELNQIVQEFYDALAFSVIELIEREKPKLVGASVNKATLPASLFALKLIRERYPEIKTVMGGAIFVGGDMTADSKMFQQLNEQTPYIDKIIMGEGELLMLKLLRGELDEEKKVYSLSDIQGTTLDICATMAPDFSDMDMDGYSLLASYTSRSCPFECSFCTETVMWGKYRKKTGKQVMNEMSDISGEFDRKLFLMCDSLLNPIASDLSREFLKKESTLYWDGYLRADKNVCVPENVDLWRRGGMYRVRLGLESGSEKILKLMNKKITPAQTEEAITNLAQAGIKTSTYWVIGHPEETEEDFQETLDLIERQKDNLYEAKCNSFNFYITGQVNSDEWANQFEYYPLYPEEMEKALISQIYLLKTNPSREEVLDRVRRFQEHCRRLNIPDPTNMAGLHEADQRWKKIQKNAVPTMLEIEQGVIVDGQRGIM